MARDGMDMEGMGGRYGIRGISLFAWIMALWSWEWHWIWVGILNSEGYTVCTSVGILEFSLSLHGDIIRSIA